MSNESETRTVQGDSAGPAEAIDLTKFKSLTPSEIVGMLRRLSLGSIVWIVGILAAVGGAGYAAGYKIAAGDAPEWAYNFMGSENTGRKFRAFFQAHQSFSENFSERVLDQKVLDALGRSVFEDRPDGIDNTQDAVEALVWQLRATAGSAWFLSGARQHGVQVIFLSDRLSFNWSEQNSIVPLILRDHRIEHSEADIRRINASLNRTGHAQISSAASLIRETNGNLSFQLKTQ